VLSAGDLRDHLDRRLELLVHGPRDLPERQQTLRATLRWSCELLDPAPRAVLRRLSVFAGSAAVEAAERVCQAAGALPGDVLPHLAALVEHSLAQRIDGPDGRPRVVLLESVREYAREELRDAGELERTAQAHLDSCADEAARAAREMRGPAEAVWLERLELEHDNMRAALTWTVDRRRTEAGLRLAISLWLLWGIGGHQREGLLWLERLLPSADEVDVGVRADAAHIAGFLAMQVGELSLAIERQRQALELSQATGDRRGVARALRGRAQALARSGEYAQAIPLLEQSVAAFSDLADEPLLALSLIDLGIAVGREGDSRRSMALYERALVIQRRLGNRQRVALCLVNLGNQAMLDGDVARARAWMAEAAAIARSGNWPYMIGLTAANFGDLALAEGDRAEALVRYREGVAEFARIGDSYFAAHCLRGLAQCAWFEGLAARAARLHGAADALSPASAEMDRQWATTNDRVWQAVKEHLGAERFAAAHELGGRLSLDDAAAEAMTDGVGAADHAGGRAVETAPSNGRVRSV
jgi:non-specific serine/threonine protein kinase